MSLTTRSSLIERVLADRSIGVFDKKDTDDGVKQEKEEQEHEQGIAKHDVFGMSIKAKDVGDDGDVRAMDTNMKVGNLCSPQLDLPVGF